ncbi:MAG TPA: hypothetical protein ENK06_07565, partial [Gammaproteobacteria bacterium]|nr:hypothetical protein [Gammaproteobacteria bacterium]
MRICRLINSGIVILVCFCSQLGWTKSFPMPSSNTMIPHLPRVFEKNQGQVAQNFSYLAQTPETYFRFARDRVDLLLNTSSDGQFPNLLRIQFPDSTGNPDITGLNRTRQYVNYLRGQASQWIKQVATFKKIEYSNIFPGIDLQFYFTKTRMEFDFIVSPGADPQQIAFEIKNADKIKINATGALEIQLGKKKLFF